MSTPPVVLAAAAAALVIVTAPLTTFAATPPSQLAMVTEVRSLPTGPEPITLEAITWRPRSPSPKTTDPAPVTTATDAFEPEFTPYSAFQLHGGISEYNDRTTRAALGGMRLGYVPDPHLNLGVSADWIYRVNHVTEPVPGEPLPGGGVTTRLHELARTTTTRLPIQAYLEFQLVPSLTLTPHAGIGGGWHMMFLSAEDNTGASFDAMYDGWGWQAWGGVTVRFGQSLRLVGEVFRTEASLGRIVEEEDGTRYHEIQAGDDVGARFGLRFGGG